MLNKADLGLCKLEKAYFCKLEEKQHQYDDKTRAK